MLLTFSTNGKQVYIKSENITVATEEEYEDEETKKTVKFTRVYLKDVVFPEDAPNWIDVKESVKVISSRIETANKKTD